MQWKLGSGLELGIGGSNRQNERQQVEEFTFHANEDIPHAQESQSLRRLRAGHLPPVNSRHARNYMKSQSCGRHLRSKRCNISPLPGPYSCRPDARTAFLVFRTWCSPPWGISAIAIPLASSFIKKPCLAKAQRKAFFVFLCAFAALRDDLFFHTDKHLVTGFLENAERIF